jgi:hypothetical protein
MPSRLFCKVALLAAAAFSLDHVVAAAEAEDPARFLAVTNWYATFTRTLRSAGVGDGICHAKWSFSNSGEIKTELPLLPGIHGIPGLPDIPPRWTDAGKTNQDVFFQLHDTGTEQCGDGEPTVIVADDQEKTQIFQFATLAVDLTQTNYTLGLGYHVLYDATVDGDPFPTSGVAWTVSSTGPIVEPLPATGMVLTGQRIYGIDENSAAEGILTIAVSALANEMELLRGELVIEWTLTPVLEEVEVVVDGPEYEDWLPKGDLKDWAKEGDTLYLTASLQTKDGNVPLAARAQNFKFELLNVSTEKGVCLNRPHEEFADTKADLKFVAQPNQPPLVAFPLQIDNDGKTAKTADDEFVIATVGVSSFDFGAYGEIKVTATVNGKEIVGYYKKDATKAQKPLLLPKRKPDSFIADKWKKDHDAENLADDDDSEDRPAGHSHKGDGFTLYEEYRGFSENLTHIRLDPKAKDFFILDRMKNADSNQGIEIFARETELKVHSQTRAEEFNAPLGAKGELFDTFINFNHSNGPHIIDQHGIAILLMPSSRGGSYAGSDPSLVESAGGAGGTPARYRTVSIDPGQLGWNSVNGGDGTMVRSPSGTSTVAHELSHTCAVWHHGPPDNPPVKWRLIDANISENGLVINPRNERGGPGVVVFLGNTGEVSIPIGDRNGVHSGAGDCYMRYDMSRAYRSTSDNHVRYLAGEVAGSKLCASPAGTGVNGPGHSPQSRYGDAAPNRGNCKSQVCVSDVYNGSGDHIR